MRVTPLSMNRLGYAASAVRNGTASSSLLDLCAFILPALSFLEVRIIGRLIVSELLALALLPWLLRSRERLRLPRWLFALWAAWLLSQVVTDVVVHSAFIDWTRGWANIIFTLIDLAALLVLAATPRRARIVAAGLAAGGLLGYIFVPYPAAATDPWKWAFAIPVAFILAAALSGASAARRPWVGVAAFAGLGLINALAQFRSLSGVAFITSAYLLLAAVAAGRNRLRRPTIARSIGGVTVYGAMALAVFVGLNAAAAANLLGEAAKAKYDAQAGIVEGASPSPRSSPLAGAQPTAGTNAVPSPASGSNPLGVIAGGRSEILTTPRAIRDSPILGHGSWAKDARYVELQREGLIDFGVPNGNEPTDPNLIPTHSYLLGSWVWAGLGGGVFWAAVAVLALWMMANLYAMKLALSPVIVFSTTFLLWNIAFSPYGNTQRLFAMFGVSVCLLGLRLAREAQRTSAAPAEQGS